MTMIFSTQYVHGPYHLEGWSEMSQDVEINILNFFPLRSGTRRITLEPMGGIVNVRQTIENTSGGEIRHHVPGRKARRYQC